MSQETVTLKVSAAATTDADATIALPYKAQILSVVLSPDVAAAANGTNYASLALTANDGAAGSFVSIATAQTTATVAHVVGTSIAFAGVTDVLAAGSIVKLAKTHAGSGVAVALTVTLVLQKVA